MSHAAELLSIILDRREVKVPTDTEWFRYIRHNWRGAYIIIQPSQDSGAWKAIACWGKGDELISETPDGLLSLIHRHYGPNTEGHAEMLMGRISRKYS